MPRTTGIVQPSDEHLLPPDQHLSPEHHFKLEIFERNAIPLRAHQHLSC